jgi:hypothetical protein
LLTNAGLYGSKLLGSRHIRRDWLNPLSACTIGDPKKDAGKLIIKLTEVRAVLAL